MKELRNNKIPIIEGPLEGTVEELFTLFNHWDRTNELLVNEHWERVPLEEGEIIHCVLVPDFVEPYKSWGSRCAVIVQCHEHENLWENQRLDIGRMEHYAEKGYKIVLIDPKTGLKVSVEDFKQAHLEAFKARGSIL